MCVLGVLFVLGNVVSNVLGVGGMYMWLCGSMSGSIICGFVLPVQIGLVRIIVFNPSLRVWGIYFLFGAACNAVSSGPGKPWVQVGSPRQVAAALGLGVFLCDAYVANGLYSLQRRLCAVASRDLVPPSVASSVASGRRSCDPVSGLPLVHHSM